MRAPCEWCAEHRKTLVKMEDDLINIERGAITMEQLVGAGEFDPSDAIKFIACQLQVISGRLNEAFSGLRVFDRVEGEDAS